VEDLSCLQRWLEKHGDRIKVLQLHQCLDTALTALPCPQLQDLLLWGPSIDSRVWSDIAAAPKLTSVTLDLVQTSSQRADVVSALTALPDLEQLTWSRVGCGEQQGLTDSLLLQKLTKLAALRIDYVEAAEVFEHVGLLTRLQDLSIGVAADRAAAGCPGLQELTALTRFELSDLFDGISAIVSQLTALQQLGVSEATPTALNKLQALTGLTQLCVSHLEDLSPPLQLSGLQHLEVLGGFQDALPSSFLGSCTQLRVLKLSKINLSPGSLAASTMLQQLELRACTVSAAEGAADSAAAASWQQVFPGPGQLPHITSLRLTGPDPSLEHADIECVVACCSSLRVLNLGNLPGTSASALACLPGLTSLTLWVLSDQQCSSPTSRPSSATPKRAPARRTSP